MADKFSENADKSSGNADGFSAKPDKVSERSEAMTQIAIEMREAMIALAGDRAWHETRQRWLERAARAAGISYRTAKALFYAEVSDPKGSVVECVRAAVARRVQEQEDIAKDEFAALHARLQSMEQRLGAIDADGDRPPADGWRAGLRLGGRADRPLDPALGGEGGHEGD